MSIMSETSSIIRLSGVKILDMEKHTFFVTEENEDSRLKIQIGLRNGPQAVAIREALRVMVAEFIGETVDLIVEEWPWSTENKSGNIYFLMEIHRNANAPR